MAEADIQSDKNFHENTPAPDLGFYLKGAASLDWGMKNRLSRIFSPESGRTVMFAIDHGYFQGPTTGLERIDLSVPPLLPYVDALMCTRGILRGTIPPSMNKPVVLRASGGPSVLHDLTDEHIAVDIADAVRVNASALAVQMFLGTEHETQSIRNLTTLVDQGLQAGIPVMAVVAVGREMVRDAKYFRLACRIGAELGAHIVKCYYVPDGFGSVVASCPVPVVVAGGKKIPERDALEMAYRAVSEGAAGVDMGRNIFQSARPLAMAQAVSAVVHQGLSAIDAFEVYNSSEDITATHHDS